jgi:hypothetical protein
MIGTGHESLAPRHDLSDASDGNRVEGSSRLMRMVIRAGLLLATVVLSACTVRTEGSPPSASSSPARPAAGSPSILSEPGWLAVDLRFSPDVFLTEGSISFVRVFDDSGELVNGNRSKDWRPNFRMQLAGGAYQVRTYRRPCDGSCRVLDPPRDACEFGAEIGADGSNRLVVVRVARGGDCRVSDRGDVIDFDPNHAVGDLASVTEALAEAGHGVHVRPGDRWLRRFVLVPDHAVKIDTGEVHVFEYASTAKRKQISISPDGTGISSGRGLAGIIEWTQPHFYRSGRLLVLYLGDDPVILETLSLLLGPQFAGP